MSHIVLTLNTGGEPGPRGEPGPPGAQGVRGQTGPRGPRGEPGQRGPMGAGITVLGSLNESTDLPTSATIGDSYIIGVNLWTYNGTQFLDMGPVRGPQGLPGVPGERGPEGPRWVTWRGNYQPNTDYMVGDGVLRFESASGLAQTMRCTVAHRSPTGLATPPVAENWEVILTSLPGPDGPEGPQGPRGEIGPRGEQGPTGMIGPQGLPGSILESWAGEWVPGIEYQLNDLVRANWTEGPQRIHALLLCINPHFSAVGNFPSPSTYPTNWILIAQLQDGTNGADGESVTIAAFSDEAVFNAYTAGPRELVFLVE